MNETALFMQKIFVGEAKRPMSLSLGCHCERRRRVAIRNTLGYGFSRLLTQAQNDKIFLT